MTDYHLGILPAGKDGTADWRSGDGTGGYSMVKFDPGVRAQLKRAPNYWKANAAYFDEVEVLAIGDIAARQNAILTGDVDVADRIDLKTVDLLRRNEQVVIENVPGRLHYTFEMMTTQEPFTDVNVRLAMKYAIDRQALLDTVLRGYGILGNDHPISPAYTYFDASIPQRQYDPEKAKFHLQKAGQSNLAVDLHVSDVAFNGATDASVLFKEQAAKAGIDINVVREPSDGYFAKVWGKLPFVVCYYTGRPTEDGVLSIAYAKDAAMNSSKWYNERANQLMMAARGELDTSKRREMYSEIQRLISDDGGFIIPLFANYVFARSSNLAHGPRLSSERSLDGAKMAERWWFA
jgi:peptide/nickel transport system substrate-binding protein